jgi:hypothetical protein
MQTVVIEIVIVTVERQHGSHTCIFLTDYIQFTGAFSQTLLYTGLFHQNDSTDSISKQEREKKLCRAAKSCHTTKKQENDISSYCSGSCRLGESYVVSSTEYHRSNLS